MATKKPCKKVKNTTKQDKIIYEQIAEEQPYCQLCGSSSNLHIHHIRYGAEGRKTYIGNLIRLCIYCHSKVHSNKKYWQSRLIKIIEGRK